MFDTSIAKKCRYFFLPANQGIDTEDNHISLNDDGGTSYIVR